MLIVTAVEGAVSPNKERDFERSFLAAKAQPLPEGLVSSVLMKSNRQLGMYRIETVWKSMEALEVMRRNTSKPKAIELLENAGANPTVQVFEVLETIP